MLRVQFTNLMYCSFGCGCVSQVLFAGASAVENLDCDVSAGAGAVKNF